MILATGVVESSLALYERIARFSNFRVSFQTTTLRLEHLNNMAIELDVPLVRELIETRFGSIDAFAAEWEHRIETRKQQSGKARDRATIYRWLKQGMPSKKQELFGLAGALDIDPIALLRIDADYVMRSFPRERFLFQAGSKTRSKLHPFWEVFMPCPNWPNEELPKTFYGRPWTKFQFKHAAVDVSNVFAGLLLKQKSHVDMLLPKVFLFAYRRTGAVDTLWRPYGVVIHYRECTRLISQNGAYQEVHHPTVTQEFLVETYLGPGPAEFQIASLHGFDASLTIPSNNSLAVRFPA